MALREQRDDQDHGRDQLDEDARAVDAGHQLHAERVDQRGEDDEDAAEDDRVDGEVVVAGAVAVELEEVRDLRQGDLVGERDGGDRHDRGGEHHPAAQPGDGGAREHLPPVVDRARHREVRRQLGEAERDHQLADEDHRPGPPVRRAAEGEAEVEELEDAGEDRDVADARPRSWRTSRCSGRAPACSRTRQARQSDRRQTWSPRAPSQVVGRGCARTAPVPLLGSPRANISAPGALSRVIYQFGRESMHDIAQFLAQHPPFDTLDEETLEQVAASRGDRVLRGRDGDPRERRGDLALRLRRAARRGRAAGRRPPPRPARRGRDVRLRLAAAGRPARLRRARGRGHARLPLPGGRRSCRCSSGPRRCASWSARCRGTCIC